jgi:hypothetical protein
LFAGHSIVKSDAGMRLARRGVYARFGFGPRWLRQSS